MASVLKNASLSAGFHGVLWDGADPGGRPAPGGVYFYRLTTAEGVLSRRLVLLK